MVFISLLINLFIMSLFANSKLPKLATKQALNNLRYISKDGKFTYYQRTNGKLLLSTNFSVKEVMERPKNSHFEVIGSPDKQRLLVWVKKDFHRYLNPLHTGEIFSIPFGKENAQKVGVGIYPKLHLKDSWASYYVPMTKKLWLQNLNNLSQKFSVQLASTKNPFFIPEVIFVSAKKILFTDINQEGFPGILSFDLSNKKVKLLSKFPNPNLKVELCEQDDLFFVSTFGLDPLTAGSEILQLSKKQLDLKKSTLIYQSKRNDLGQVICNLTDNSLYFIKNETSDEGKQSFEASKINLATKKSSIISDVKYATRLVNMDGNLYLPYNGEFLVLLGEGNLTQFDLLKKGTIK